MIYINVKHVKDLALDLSQKQRAGKFTRISKAFLERIDAKVRNLVLSEVMSHPSVGKTLK